VVCVGLSPGQDLWRDGTDWLAVRRRYLIPRRDGAEQHLLYVCWIICECSVLSMHQALLCFERFAGAVQEWKQTPGRVICGTACTEVLRGLRVAIPLAAKNASKKGVGS
jgi:hypothetical protein